MRNERKITNSQVPTSQNLDFWMKTKHKTNNIHMKLFDKQKSSVKNYAANHQQTPFPESSS